MGNNSLECGFGRRTPACRQLKKEGINACFEIHDPRNSVHAHQILIDQPLFVGLRSFHFLHQFPASRTCTAGWEKENRNPIGKIELEK